MLKIRFYRCFNAILRTTDLKMLDLNLFVYNCSLLKFICLPVLLYAVEVLPLKNLR